MWAANQQQQTGGAGPERAAALGSPDARRLLLVRPRDCGWPIFSLVIMPRQHDKLTWRGMELSDTIYKVYGLKNHFES